MADDHVHRAICADCGAALTVPDEYRPPLASGPPGVVRAGREAKTQHPRHADVVAFLDQYTGKSSALLRLREAPSETWPYDEIERVVTKAIHFREWWNAKNPTPVEPALEPPQPKTIDHPDRDEVMEFLRSYDGTKPFLLSLSDQLLGRATLSFKQIAAAADGADFRKWARARAAAPSGKTPGASDQALGPLADWSARHADPASLADPYRHDFPF